MKAERTIDISFNTEQGRFLYRVAGVVIHDGKVLLLTEDRFDFWYLPGGRASLFETSVETLVREIAEELSVIPIVERLLWTVENIYHYSVWNANNHELAFYYLMRFPEGTPLYEIESGIGKEEFSDEETVLRFRWFPLEELATLHLVPEFLKEGLLNIPSSHRHVILNSVKVL